TTICAPRCPSSSASPTARRNAIPATAGTRRRWACCFTNPELRILRRGEMLGDLAGGREPDAVRRRAHVLQRAPQMRQPERLADDERMNRNAEDQRLLFGLLEHLVELVDDHVGEFIG